MVESVNNGQITIIEGNYQNAVCRRTIPVGWGYIRGYAAPRYEDGSSADHAGSAGDGSAEGGATVTPPGRAGDSSEGRRLSMRPRWRGKVTASALNVRSWAGMEFNNIKSVPVLHYGDLVEVCDTLLSETGEKWYYVRINGRVFGFVHGDFVVRG